MGAGVEPAVGGEAALAAMILRTIPRSPRLAEMKLFV